MKLLTLDVLTGQIGMTEDMNLFNDWSVQVVNGWTEEQYATLPDYTLDGLNELRRMCACALGYRRSELTSQGFLNANRIWRETDELVRLRHPYVSPVFSEAEPAVPLIRRTPGYVYLIRSSDGLYKIGRSGNPNNRMRTFKLTLPFDVEYECVIHTDDMVALEKQLHRKYTEKRIRGEWFKLSARDVKYIKGLAKS